MIIQAPMCWYHYSRSLYYNDNQDYKTEIMMVFSIGFLMVLPFGWNEFSTISWNSLNATAIACLSLIVIAGTFLAYIFNVYGIKNLGASVAGAYMYSQPVFATIIAMIFLKESLDLYKIIAAMLIFTGVYLSNKSIRKS